MPKTKKTGKKKCQKMKFLLEVDGNKYKMIIDFENEKFTIKYGSSVVMEGRYDKYFIEDIIKKIEKYTKGMNLNSLKKYKL